MMKKILKLIILLSAATFTASCAKDIVDLTGDIQGTVKEDDGGKLLENCRVALSPGGKSTWTDANGAFAFEDLEAGTYTLSFSKSGYVDATQEVSVTTGQTTRVNIYMKLPSATTGTISGTIKDYANGQLISNCNVSISPNGTSVTSSSSGTYEFSDLTPGSYSLTFSKAGYEDANTTVTVKAGKNSTADVLIKAKSAFALSESSYDFGDMEVSKTFYFFNNSDESTSFSISNLPSWLSFSQTSGAIKVSGNEAVTATVDRSKVSEGEYHQNVTISYSGKTSGSVNLSVKMKKVVLSAPAVSISGSAENIKQTSFDISGNITATGGSEVTNYGHCWNTTGNPTINDSKTDLGTTSAICSFKSTAENLSTYTTYYVRAYAKNAQGISYSEQVAVTTQDVASDKWDGNIASSFEGGSGTRVDPYLVRTGGQLLLMKNYSSEYFKLVGNIDLNNNNWLPFDFTGSLDGAGYIVKNLYVNRNNDNLGLFSMINNGSVSNLTISGVKIEAGSNNCIGALVGDFQCGEIVDCKVLFLSDSKVLGNSNVGGLVGTMGNRYADSKKISGCVVTASSSAIMGESNVGGVLGGYTGGNNGEIERCQFKGSIKGTSKVGGIVGHQQDGKLILRECQASVNIEASTYAGGLFGSCYHNGSGCTYIYASKAIVQITIKNGNAGGLFGGGQEGARLMNIIASYADGTIKGTSSSCNNVGGLGIGSDCSLCYSTVTSSLSSFKQTGYLGSGSQNNTGSYETADISQTLRDAYSEYATYYNFNNTWIWSGNVGGSSKSVKCPKLSWE